MPDASRDALPTAALYARYAPLVYALALGGLRDRLDAEDVVQDVFLKVWRHGGLDPARGDPAPWLAAIARNAVRDRLRRKAAWSRGVCALALALAATVPPGTEDPLAEAMALEMLDRLPPPQLAVVRLVCLEGLTVAEAARLLRTPLGTAKSRLRAGLRRLRREFGLLPRRSSP